MKVCILERTEHVKQVIRKEFDVEILYKWREIRILEDELEKGEQLKILLEKLILNGIKYLRFFLCFNT